MTDRYVRGVSTVLGYVLTLGITALLVGALMIAGGQYVEDQRDRVVRSEMAVVGERFASDLESADRLAASGASAVRVDSTLPSRLGGVGYELTIRDEVTHTDHPNHYVIELSTRGTQVDVTTTTEIGLAEDLVIDTVRGGDLEIVLSSDGGGGHHLEVRVD